MQLEVKEAIDACRQIGWVRSFETSFLKNNRIDESLVNDSMRNMSFSGLLELIKAGSVLTSHLVL